ncbi:MAG: glutamate synthase subunit beta [Cellulomonadaceae bacterium]
MADPRGFLRIRERERLADRPVPLRTHDWREVHTYRPAEPDDPAMVSRQASRCMGCGVPFCHFSCPLGNLVPDFNDLVRRGAWRDAAERLHSTNNFPEFTGRLCPAPCEAGCVLGVNQPAVTIKNVELAIVEEAFDRGLVTPYIAQRYTDRSVAVVGSGPAGLAAAQQLTRAGHTVTVLERADRAGGLLRYGIPEFKMEKHVIDRRLEVMRDEGTRFRTGVNVGRDMTGQELLARFDAVVVATGSTVPRDLPVPGRTLTGVLQAMEYLPPANCVAARLAGPGGAYDAPRDSDPAPDPDQVLATDKHVVVIGGGDTGADCLGTALRQGARSVTQLEIMPRPEPERTQDQPWPLYPMLYRVSSAHEEGGERVYAVSTEELLGDADGAVRALRLVEVERVEGRFERIEGSEREIPAQLVLLAMGFTGPEPAGLLDQLGVSFTGRGTVARGADFATDVPGVFVAGDAGRGQSLIVWAIAEGRAAASAVDAYLTGTASELPAPITAQAAPLRL